MATRTGMKLNRLKSLLFKTLLAVLFASFSTVFASEEAAPSEGEETKFNAAEMIKHHISDAYDWHLFGEGHASVSIPLPVILYSTTKGLQVFSSANFHHGTEAYIGYKLEHNHLIAEDSTEKIYDFSITKNVASMMIASLIIILIFLSISSSYKKNVGQAPKGMQSVFEPLITFVRDEIAEPNIGPKFAKYLPYLLTVFFFIWVNNLLGLIPTGANTSGNIAFTMTLAVITLLFTLFSGNKDYWMHIFWTPGVPMPLRVIMLPVEIIGIFTKPFALMIRLFANITAGHIIILSILSFIFIFKSFAVAGVSIPFAVVMSLMEVFVAALQAYIFTLLSALFIGQAVAEHEHHEDHH
ncbi:MAG: ATP synthase F0 subunit A [Bacteroidetes bacterium]|nr:MAG: ATP synthase F0 subunit A [Bacteroidota bacterium]